MIGQEGTELPTELEELGVDLVAQWRIVQRLLVQGLGVGSGPVALALTLTIAAIVAGLALTPRRALTSPPSALT